MVITGEARFVVLFDAVVWGVISFRRRLRCAAAQSESWTFASEDLPSDVLVSMLMAIGASWSGAYELTV